MGHITDGLDLPGRDTKPTPTHPLRKSPDQRGLRVALALLLVLGAGAFLVLQTQSVLDPSQQGPGPIPGSGLAAPEPAAGLPGSTSGASPTAAGTADATGTSATSPDRPGVGPVPTPPRQGPAPIDPGAYPGRPARDTPTHINPLPG